MEETSVVRDGVIVDYIGATRIVERLKEQVEGIVGRVLNRAAACAIPPGITEGNIKVISNVVESADFEVDNVVDEPYSSHRAGDYRRRRGGCGRQDDGHLHHPQRRGRPHGGRTRRHPYEPGAGRRPQNLLRGGRSHEKNVPVRTGRVPCGQAVDQKMASIVKTLHRGIRRGDDICRRGRLLLHEIRGRIRTGDRRQNDEAGPSIAGHAALGMAMNCRG